MEEFLQIYSYIIGILSALFLWVGFLIFGFIARRYNIVFNKSTYYPLLMLAPSGFLFYSILLILQNSLPISNTKILDSFYILAYICFFISSILCLLGVLKFNKLLNELLKYKGE